MHLTAPMLYAHSLDRLRWFLAGGTRLMSIVFLHNAAANAAAQVAGRLAKQQQQVRSAATWRWGSTCTDSMHAAWVHTSNCHMTIHTQAVSAPGAAAAREAEAERFANRVSQVVHAAHSPSPMTAEFGIAYFWCG